MRKEEKADRIKEYLTPMLDEFIFDEFSADYLEKANIGDIMAGVSVPFRAEDLSGGAGTLDISRNMAFIIGCDPSFCYAGNYLAYIRRHFGNEFAKGVSDLGAASAEAEDYDKACAWFRAAMLIDPDLHQARFSFARACHDAYETDASDDASYVGNFKAESLEQFELYTLEEPGDALGHYYLGYGYLNLGLYAKADAAFSDFMKLCDSGELRAEVRSILDRMRDPIEIERGCNEILAGRYRSGIEILDRFENDPEASGWWPLWYYLGTAYEALGSLETARDKFFGALKLSPSNIEAMEHIASISRTLGDDITAEKYERKIEVVSASEIE